MVAKILQQPPCKFPGCLRFHHCKGYCKAHYSQLSRGQELRPLTDALPRTCRIPDCGKPVKAIRRQLCDNHYSRWQRGTLDGLKPRPCAICRTVFTPIRRANTQCCSDACSIKQAQLRKHYGIDGATLNAMLDAQDWQCAICGDAITLTTLQTDHDHSCCPGDISCGGMCLRDLLCGPCNRGVGLFKDDPIRLEAAALYLLKHKKS